MNNFRNLLQRITELSQEKKKLEDLVKQQKHLQEQVSRAEQRLIDRDHTIQKLQAELEIKVKEIQAVKKDSKRYST